MTRRAARYVTAPRRKFKMIAGTLVSQHDAVKSVVILETTKDAECQRFGVKLKQRFQAICWPCDTQMSETERGVWRRDHCHDSGICFRCGVRPNLVISRQSALRIHPAVTTENLRKIREIHRMDCANSPSNPCAGHHWRFASPFAVTEITLRVATSSSRETGAS